MGDDRLSVLGGTAKQQDQHKVDVPQELSLSVRQRTQMQNGTFMDFIRTLQREMDEPTLINLLNAHSADRGRAVGERQAQTFPNMRIANNQTAYQY